MTSGLDTLRDITIFGKYALHLRSEQRRESWPEIVHRNRAMHERKYGHIEGMGQLLDEVYDHVLNFRVMPSMRSLQFGGAKIESSNCRIYNCSFLHLDAVESFAEGVYLLLCGCGVGYSAQEHHVAQLPPIAAQHAREYHAIPDNIEGWADAFKALMRGYMGAQAVPDFDYSYIRPEGAYIEGANGRAPGPDPLRGALEAVEAILRGAMGRQLTTLEAHDIMCHAAGCVQSGGVRRSAMISLFSKGDDAMFHSKSPVELREIEGALCYSERSPFLTSGDVGSFKPVPSWLDVAKHRKMIRGIDTLPYWVATPHRAAANNSQLCLRNDTSQEEFDRILRTGLEFGSGEPAALLTDDLEWGFNPCAEIAFRANMFCNVTEINAGDIVDQADYNARARCAAILGTLQAGYTDYPYLRPIWAERCREEALLGVGMTGIASGALDGLDMAQAARVVLATNEEIAALIGINRAHRLTCVKPSGTSSCVLRTSSGIHAWYAPHYLRRALLKRDEAVYRHIAQAMPGLLEDHLTDPNAVYLCMPVAAPAGVVTAADETVAQFLARLHKIHLDWIHPGHRQGINRHNASATASPRPHEWDELIDGLWAMRADLSGISVYPYDTGSYTQPPFKAISEERYHEMAALVREVDLSKVVELDDYVEFESLAACAGGSCDLDYA